MDVNHSPATKLSTTLRLESWNICKICPGFTTDPDLNHRGPGLPRKTALIDRELANLAVDIATLQETRLADTSSITEQNFTFFWTGKAEEDRIHGVGFAVSNRLLKEDAVDTPTRIPERIMTLKVNCAASALHLVSVYAPTLTSEDHVKDEFYDRLNVTLNRIPVDDHLLLLGDFNARVGANHAAWPDIIGHFGIGKMNENGQRVLELCSQHELCIANTWFQQKMRRRVPWRHPRSKHWHQLDLALCRKRDIGLVKWSRTYHSADGDTDHSLILSQVNLPKKKPAPKKPKPRRSLNTAAMRESDNIKAFCTAFEAKLRGSAPDVGIDPVDPDVCWEN